MKKRFLKVLLGVLVRGVGGIVAAVNVEVPPANGQADIVTPGNTRIESTESQLFTTVGLVNRYLWYALAVVLFVFLVKIGMQLITARGDEQKFQKVTQSFQQLAYGILIVLFSYLIVRVVVNLL